MDWTQVFTIIGGFFAGFVYMMNRMDAKFALMDAKIDSKLNALEEKMDRKFDSVHAEIRHLDSKISNIEGQITQMTRSNIVPFNHPPKNDAKEN